MALLKIKDEDGIFQPQGNVGVFAGSSGKEWSLN